MTVQKVCRTIVHITRKVCRAMDFRLGLVLDRQLTKCSTFDSQQSSALARDRVKQSVAMEMSQRK